jgi:YD repeat-containing protein
LFRSEPARPSSGFFSKKHGRTAFLTSVVMTLSVLSASSNTTTPPPLGALATSTVSSNADYVYDEAGRLVTALHPSGELARYEYDAAGNIIRIKRETAPTQGVIDFNPRIGKAGTPVTILGRGFDNDRTKNTVTFGPEAASVISASPNRLEVRVPDHAANGQIRIVTPTGTLTSPRSFVVPPPGPSISGVVPNVVEPGTTAVISGTNFRPRTIENVVSLNGVLSEVPSATATALTVTIPQQAASGPLTVATPYGDASSGDIFVPTNPFQASDVGYTGRLGVDGSAITANLPATGKIGMLIFAGTAGQRITMTVSDIAIDEVDISIVKPDGALLVWNNYRRGQDPVFIDTKVLPMAGTYTVLIDPRNDDTGTVKVALNPVPDDETGTTTVGGPAATATTTVPGQNSKRTFPGTAGQRITMTVSDIAIDEVDISIVKPDGALLVWNNYRRGQDPVFIDTKVLPMAGTYTVLIDPRNDDTGTVKVALNPVPDDETGTTTVGGPATTATTTVPGQNSKRTFPGTAGQRITMTVSDIAIDEVDISIVKPDGALLVWNNYRRGQDPVFIDTKVLPMAGTYTVLIDPRNDDTGTVKVALNPVPDDETGTTTVGGPATTATTTVPGQNSKRTFPGTAGQRITMTVSDIAIDEVDISIVKPDGALLVWNNYRRGQDPVFIDTKVLPMAGTYTVLIDPRNDDTGTVKVALNPVPDDETGTTTVGGPAATATTTVPGQNSKRTFPGTAGQRITMTVSDIAIDEVDISIVKPDGALLVWNNYRRGQDPVFIDTKVLPMAGTYTVLIDPRNDDTGTVKVALNPVPDDETGTTTVGGPAATATTTVPGQNSKRTFPGTAGQRITMTVSDIAIDEVDISIVKPDGALLVWNNYRRGQDPVFIDTKVLPMAGTYTVLIDPRNDDTGTVKVALNPVPDDETGTTTVGGPAATATTTVPGQNSKRTFPGTAGQRITMTVSDIAIDAVDISIVKPDGALLVWNNYRRGQLPASKPAALPVAGTYTVLIDPRNDDTGTVKVKLSANSNPPALPGINPAVARHASAGSLPAQLQLKPHIVSAAPTSMESSVGALAVRVETKRVGAAEPGMLKGPKATPAAKRTGATGDLAGVILRLDGRPLAQVRVWADKMQTRTDGAGNFTLAGLPPGHHELYVDGSTANTSRDRYGLFEIGADVEAGKLTILPSTIWMTELDTEHEIAIPSPTTKTTIISTPLIKGLEVHLPAGTVVRDEDGKPVRRLGITRIPIDKTPFPLPKIGVQTPVYFTVQPGGSYVFPKGARIIYPNYTDLPARQRVEFWNYDPEERGWHIYGYGRVSPDRKQVIPDVGVMVYNFAGAMFNPANTPPADGPPPGACSRAGDPVDCSTGLFLNEQTDLRLTDIIPLNFARTYRSNDTVSRAFGIGSSSSYDLYLWSAEQYKKVDLILPDGGRVHYKRVSAGTGYQDAVFEHTGSTTSFHKSRITWAGDVNGWHLRLRDGRVLEFQQYRSLKSITDRFGNRISIERTNNGRGPISHITSPSGRWISFTSDSAGRIAEARDNIGRTITYAYDTLGRLSTVTDPVGGITRYTYDTAHRMLSITTPRGTTKVTTVYDQNGRVTAQTLANGGQWKFQYKELAGHIGETVTTNPRGQKTRITYNQDGYPLTKTEAFDTSISQTTTFTRDADNFITSTVDSLSRRTEYARDALGNLTTVTRAAGSKEESRSFLTYTVDYSQLASIMDPLGNKTAIRYDSRGAMAEVTDALGRTTRINTDTAGRPVAVTNALNATTAFSYDRGRLASVTDPLGRTRRQWIDPAGRSTFTVDPLGAVTSRMFDELDRVTVVSDATGSTTQWTYDPNGNIASMTDPRGGVSRWMYDASDRPTSRTDPLNRTEQFSYDHNDNLVEAVDRRGIVTKNSYDELDRPITSRYGTAITDAYVFDAGNRIIRATSSPASPTGAVLRVFDALDRLIAEQTDRGKITYDFDKADHRTRMTIAGQTPVTYAYDAANQLKHIGRGNSMVEFALDASGRRTTVTLPNGIVTNYTYDEADQIQSIKYSKAATPLGTIDYSYDQAGRRSEARGVSRRRRPARCSFKRHLRCLQPAD